MKVSSLYFVALLVALCGCCCTTAVDKSIQLLGTVPLTSCFSEGLAISNGTLYQSCGGHYDSKVRALDLQTGVVLRSMNLPVSHFGEGLTVVGENLFVITWTTHTLLVFRAADLALVEIKQFSTSTGEGWGLTHDGQHLIMSDGSDTITFFRFPQVSTHHEQDELVKVRSLRVYHPDEQIVVARINELEYVDGFIYANMWRSDTMCKLNHSHINLLASYSIFPPPFTFHCKIVKFRADTGEITQTFNLSVFASESARMSTYLAATEFRPQDVGPNGIAFYEADNTFVLAGKLWPHYYVTHLQHPSTEETPRRDAAPSHKMFGLLVLVCLFLLWLLAMFHGLCHNCFFAGTSYADRDFPYEPVQP